MSIEGIQGIRGAASVSDLARTMETPPTDAEEAEGFSAHVRALMGDLENSATSADQAAEGLVSGRVELHQAMVTMEKANIALRVGTTVRNKILDAYRQLSQVSG